MQAKRCDDIVRANSGAAAVQLDLFCTANHSIDPGWGTVWVGCGWLRCLAASNSTGIDQGWNQLAEVLIKIIQLITLAVRHLRRLPLATKYCSLSKIMNEISYEQGLLCEVPQGRADHLRVRRNPARYRIAGQAKRSGARAGEVVS